MTATAEDTVGFVPGAAHDGIALHDTGRTGSDRRAVRRAVVPPDIRDLVRRERMTRADARASVLHNAALVAAWAALSAAGVVAGTLWLWVPVWVAQAFLLHGAYSAMHDGAHGSMFPSRRANRVAAVVWAVPLALNGNLWRCWHLEHHRATATPDDPEPAGDVTNIGLYVAAFPFAGLSMLLENQWHTLLCLAGRPPGYADRPAVRGLVRWNAALSLLAAAGAAAAGVLETGWTLRLWLVPLALYWLVVGLIFGLPEHLGTRRDEDATQIDVTRTTQTNPVLAFVIWNSNRHTAHHLVPTVNYRHLPAVDEALGDRVPYRSGSYWKYHSGLVRSLLRRG